MHVERVVGRWRLLLPASCTDERATPGAAARPSPDVLAFRVANGHLPAVAEAELQLADGEQFIEREARRLGLDESTSLEWADGERALIFEMDVPRNQARRLRVSGPTDLAWALFEPGADGDWRSRATASAVGFAADASQVKLRQGVWALVLFHDSAAVPTGPVEIAFDEEDAKAVTVFLADAHELRRFVLGTLALAVVLSLGEAGRIYLQTGNVWTTWGVLPLGVAFLLFPASFAVSTLWHCFHNMRILRGEQAYRSASFANRPLEIERTTWPSVTIQIPIFREPFDAVIRPTLESARKAAERYREKTGARCNVLVCDDGLLCFAGNDLEGALADARSTPPHARSTAQAELVARIAYYEDADVAFVARPWPQPGVPGTERAGRFRKASNLNYSLRLADRLEPSEPLSEAHARFRTELPERAYALGVSGGDVRVGEFIVQLDKDSMMPPDVIQATVLEFLADPTLAYTQHSTYPTNEDRYFSAMIGWFTRLLFDLAIRSKCLIAGSMVPMLGHNLFLRRADLLREGGWHEHSVCEDLEMMMRFHVGGRHGKYICYPGQDFGEAVTRVYTEELEKVPALRLRRRRSGDQPDHRVGAPRHHQGVLAAFLSLGARALVSGAGPAPVLLLADQPREHRAARGDNRPRHRAPLSAPWHEADVARDLRRRPDARDLSAAETGRSGGHACQPHLALAVRRVEGGLPAALALGFSFIGYSLAVMRGALAHLFNRPLVFAETNADDLGPALAARPSAQRRRCDRRRGTQRCCSPSAGAGGLAVLSQLVAAARGRRPLDWRSHARVALPAGRRPPFAPFVFHPYLVGGPDLPQRLAQRRHARGEPPAGRAEDP